MFEHSCQLRVRYGETDQMGYMYYGRYAELFEVGRVEALRSLGFPYKRLEGQGILLPVHDLVVKYHLPARYDDLLTVRTLIERPPTVRIRFRYEVTNDDDQLLTEASTTLVFIDAASGRPRRAPEELVDAMSTFFPKGDRG